MKHFAPNEFMLQGQIVYHKMDKAFLRKLDYLREQCGIPLVITSSYRTPEYNKLIGGATKSKHLEGIAVDVACDNGKDRLNIVEAAIDLGLTVGVGNTFIHLDNRFGQIIFGYG